MLEVCGSASSPSSNGTASSASSLIHTMNFTSTLWPAIPVRMRLMVDSKRVCNQSCAYAFGTPMTNDPSSYEITEVGLTHVSNVALVICSCSSPSAACQI